MNRRDFLQRLGGLAAGVALSPLLDLAEILPAPSLIATPTTGTIGAISRSTYPFWRSQAAFDTRPIDIDALRRCYADCNQTAR